MSRKAETTVSENPVIAGTPITLMEPNENKTPTVEQIRALASSGDPAKMALAQQMLSIYESLKRVEAVESDKTDRLKMAYMVADSASKEEAERLRGQEMCGRANHRRPGAGIDGNYYYINGQKAFDSVIRFICSNCQKQFDGVGDGPNQLRAEIAMNLGPDAIGGIGVI